MSPIVEQTRDELGRRHRAALLSVAVAFVLTVLLMCIALTGLVGWQPVFNPYLANTLRLIVIFLGFGAVVLRRTRFAPMRLQDIASLRGTAGLLETLQRTTLYVTLLAVLIAIVGFVISLLTGDGRDMLYFGIISIAVLLYAYPRRAAWESVVRAAATDDQPGASAKGSFG